MHTCKKCRGFSRRSSHPQNPARQRGGTLGFGNRKRGRIHEKGKSRYDDSVVHTDFVWMIFSPDEHLQKNHSHSPSWTPLFCLRSHGTPSSSPYLSVESNWTRPFHSCLLHLDVPQATHYLSKRTQYLQLSWATSFPDFLPAVTWCHHSLLSKSSCHS